MKYSRYHRIFICASFILRFRRYSVRKSNVLDSSLDDGPAPNMRIKKKNRKRTYLLFSTYSKMIRNQRGTVSRERSRVSDIGTPAKKQRKKIKPSVNSRTARNPLIPDESGSRVLLGFFWLVVRFSFPLFRFFFHFRSETSRASSSTRGQARQHVR